jgi:hypothetical protein
MAITVRCRCGKQIKTKDEYAGKRLMCPGCGSTLEVPRPAPAPPVTAGAAARPQG